ncbi:Protein argonaute like [Actinidia chinensis var. chinensis]|uniref:Protein argonaute like n=1 Tax=Actinidia chinensis var. chinensis TaxID=1590841 RepID=A0A2R6P329_ACTCC|nr:Protein argonaute like [Actinidia chinensis var. chinensis]
MERSKCSRETGVARGRNGGGNRGGGRRNYSHQQYRSGGERGGWGHQWADPSNVQVAGPTRGGRSGSRVWSEGPIQPQPQPEFQSQTERVQQTFPDMESLEISEQKPPLILPESTEKRIMPMKRPNKGGTLAVRSVGLFANHFPVRFSTESSIMHYDVDIKPHMSPDMQSVNTSIRKSDLRLIVDKLVSDDATRFPNQMIVYDGNKNMLSAVPLPTSQVTVKLFGGDGTEGRSYIVIIKLVNELKYSKLQDYSSGKLPYIPRDILQAIDSVMKENPSRHRICVGRSFYSNKFRAEDDLKFGIAAFRGFQLVLKLTSQGVVLCVDSSVMAFRKSLPVIDFLKEHVRGFEGANDVRELRREVMFALKGLKVTVTHRITNQKYIISGLSDQNAREIAFPLQNAESNDLPRKIGLVEYFRQKYDKEVIYMDIPCLNLGKGNRQNYVPMEFCSLVEGQRYPTDKLGRESGKLLKKISMPSPMERKNAICEMLRADDGPRGNVLQNFGMEVENNMTRLLGRVIGPPKLKLRTSTGEVNAITVDHVKCDWNLVRNSVVEGKPLERWALIDFSKYERNRLNPNAFIPNLIKRCSIRGVLVQQPVVYHYTGMREFYSVAKIRTLLASVVKEANGKCKGGLQLIICVMPEEHQAYNYLKWVSEREIGVLTQCCLAGHANEGKDNFFANLALKINAKLGGSNTELMECFPGFEGEDHVMFVGADVNHPAAASDVRCTSIAAVVATINWPAANRYAARICPQERRKEQIVNFGSMCLDLVNTYARINKVKPKKIVVFRDGVSDGQFDMVLNAELLDLQRAIYTENYRPTITLIVAQKRHMTRLFLENGKNGICNVPPGTVVDTTIVDPSLYDFYLCSHYGTIGTSKPTHYYVLRDEHNFTADQLQKLIYDLCFTFARCTKPVSLVPPVYYADLVAFRGRQYQDVVMELQLPAPVSKSSSLSVTSSSASLSAALLDPKFYKLHPDLENEMFFV